MGMGVITFIDATIICNFDTDSYLCIVAIVGMFCGYS